MIKLKKEYTYAIVGASNNPDKFGYKVMQDLLAKGFKLIPINLQAKAILGEKVYPQLSDYPGKIDVVIFIVPPQITQKVLKEVKQLGIDKVWFQPGSESPQAIKFCQENNIDLMHNACVMRI